MNNFWDAWKCAGGSKDPSFWPDAWGSFIDGYTDWSLGGRRRTPRYINSPAYMYGYDLGEMHIEEEEKTKTKE